MDANDREAILKNLSEAREQMLATVAGISDSQWHFRPRPECWTVAEIIEHVTIVERRVPLLVTRAMSASPQLESRSSRTDAELLPLVEDRVNRIDAPEQVRPKGMQSSQEVLTAFEETRAKTIQFVSELQGDLRGHLFPHPALGPLDCHQWLLLAGYHGKRHNRQIEEVLLAGQAAPGRAANSAG